MKKIFFGYTPILNENVNFGLLVMRVGLAAVLLLHSLPTLFGGEAQWKNVVMTTVRWIRCATRTERIETQGC